MKAAICDDNLDIRARLDTGLRSLQPDKVKTELFGCGEEIVKRYEKGRAGFDVIFLDIEMQGMDGIETANRIRRMDRHVLIVFVTSHTVYMQKSFECRPFRFLVKPVSAEDLQKVYGEICQCLAEEQKAFVFMENKQHIRILGEDILFFESRGHWIILHKKDGRSHKILKNMKELLENVDDSQFFRIHRAFVVNMSFVYEIKNTELTLHGYDKPLPIGRVYKKDFLQCFKKFAERSYLL